MKRGFLSRCVGYMLSVGVLALGMAGCGASGETDNGESREIVLTGEMIPMAEYQEVRLDLSSLEQYEWQGEHFLYLEQSWNKEREMLEGTLFRVNVDGTGVPEALYSGASDMRSVLGFALGRDRSLFFLERQEENGTNAYYLCKLDENMQEVYQQEIEDDEFLQLARERFPVSRMYADEQGNLVVLNDGGKASLFDQEGRFLGISVMEAPEYIHRFVDAGEQGCYLVCQDGSAFDTSVYLFQRVNFAEGRLEEAERKDLSAAQGQDIESITVLGSGSLGFLISAESRLCSYDYGTGECTELLNWQKLGVDGSIIRKLSFLQEDFPLENLNGYRAAPAGEGEVQTVLPAETADGAADQMGSPDISPVLEAFFFEDFSSGTESPEIVRVGYVDRGLVPEKQTVTIGMSMLSTGYLSKLVRSFNRTNREYMVVLKDYEGVEAFTEELLFHQEELPDILEVRWLNKDMLEKKGLLADLKPYFEESDTVGEKDILEAVWKACESDGALTSIMTSFSIESLAASADIVPREGWTYDQFFELAEAYPDSRLLQVYSPVAVWNLLSNTMDSYIDWDAGKCSFGSPEFIRLLERVRALDYPENQEDQRIWFEDEETAKFLKREFLLMNTWYHSPYDFSSRYAKFQDKAWEVGFPSQEGGLCYLLSPVMQFSVYENSPQKEGAWVFLEYVLSEEQQSWYGSEYAGFPVRREAFETYLTKPFHPLYNMQNDYSSEETAELIRGIVEHLKMEQPMAGGEIADIIWEELGAFFAGDKTSQQCAETIQNRVQLYLDENF